MNISSKFHKLLALAALFMPIYLTADEAKRVPVGESPQIEELAIDEEMGDFKDNARTGWWGDYPPVYYPNYSHWMISISVLGDTLIIEDGSIWEIDRSDRGRVQHWKTKDPIVLTQNRSWFSSYKYRMINTDKKHDSSIDVNLKEGPYIDGEYTHYIAIMDRRNGELALTDNTNWQVCPKDHHTFHHWKENQAIIIGVNSGWESSFDLILINVNTNNYVRAKQF